VGVVSGLKLVLLLLRMVIDVEEEISCSIFMGAHRSLNCGD
jgi:hypothetical protein